MFSGFFRSSNVTGPRTYMGTCMFAVGEAFSCSGPPTFYKDEQTGAAYGLGGAMFMGYAFTGVPGGESLKYFPLDRQTI